MKQMANCTEQKDTSCYPIKHKCAPGSSQSLLCLTSRNKRSLTLQEVELTGGGVEAHEVEAAGGPAAASLSRWLPGGQSLQHAALPSPVQTEDEDLALPTLLFLLQAENKDNRSPETFKKHRHKAKTKVAYFIKQWMGLFAEF